MFCGDERIKFVILDAFNIFKIKQIDQVELIDAYCDFQIEHAPRPYRVDL